MGDFNLGGLMGAIGRRMEQANIERDLNIRENDPAAYDSTRRVMKDWADNLDKRGHVVEAANIRKYEKDHEEKLNKAARDRRR